MALIISDYSNALKKGKQRWRKGRVGEFVTTVSVAGVMQQEIDLVLVKSSSRSREMMVLSLDR